MKKTLALLCLNTVMMLAAIHLTYQPIADGYIVSVFYATVLFYIFGKSKTGLPNNKFVMYMQEIGLSFYLLHFNIGTPIKDFIYAITGKPYLSIILGIVGAMLVISFYHFTIYRYLHKLLLIPLKNIIHK